MWGDTPEYTGLRVWKDAPPVSSLPPPLKFSTWYLSIAVLTTTDPGGQRLRESESGEAEVDLDRERNWEERCLHVTS